MRLQLFQDLFVQAVARNDICVRVDLRDRRGDAHWIEFQWPDAQSASAQAQALESWRDRDVPLTYVKGAGTGALVNDEELFTSAFGGGGSPYQ